MSDYNSDDMNENPEAVQDEPIDNSTPQELHSEDSKPVAGKASTINARKATRSAKERAENIRFWIVSMVIVIAVLALLKLIVQDIQNKSYHVKAFHVPEEFEKNGYDGVTVAYQVLDRVNERIRLGNSNRTIQEVDEYNNSSDKTSLQVEVIGGAALSVETITSFLRQALGIKERTIGGEIVKEEKGLKLVLRVNGEIPQMIVVPYSLQGSIVSLNQLLDKAADAILMKTNPFLLGLYFSRPTGNYIDSLSYEKSEIAFKETITKNPADAANAYAGWALAIQFFSQDTVEGFQKIKKALQIDSGNSFVYRNWATIVYNNANYNRSRLLYKRSLELDSTSVDAWYQMANLTLTISSTDDALAEVYFKKSLALDPTYALSITGLAEALYHQGKYKEASERIELAPSNLSLVSAYSIIIYEALGDTLKASRIFTKMKQSDRVRLGSVLNAFAYDIEVHKKYDVALRYVHMALQSDSTSKNASYTFSTLAELYGFNNNRNGFFTNLEKSLRMGAPWSSEFEQAEPYKRFTKDERYVKLRLKYGS